ncbi:hypothetical protein NDU88_005542 [Pleurodeles waltl]|uniref:Uncharacterized protein n=1 Tax=Pleurodeles waltl TaxID=8319 RepID=A0AAV7LPU8_PLEWA|nr:hypothetical protein NDU88_005542 [Pleurodeles waltl]
MSRCAKLLGDAVGANSTVPMKNYLWLDPVYEDTFSGAANILEADSASEDVMDNYDIPAQEVEVSKDHPDNLGRNVTYRSRLVERMEWGGCGELEEGAVGVDQGGEQADTGVGVLSYLNKLQGNSMLFDELYYIDISDYKGAWQRRIS